VDDSIIEVRLTGRRSCPACGATFHITGKPPKEQGKCDLCGAELIIRKDDQPETIQQRLKVFHAETEPLIKFYENLGRLSRVNSGLPVAEVRPQIFRALGI
jgi:adenylate kinase